MIGTDKYAPGDRRGDGTSGDIALKEAWLAFSEGRAGREDYEFIMGDLGEFSGFFSVAPADATGEQLQRAEGRREVFARILYLVDVSRSERLELASTVRREMIITSQEGER